MARREAIFSVKVDSDDAIKDVKKLDQDMTHLAETIGVEVSGSISAMEDRLYEMALAGDTTSKEFQELQQQTAKYKQIVIETDRSIDALAEQGRGLSSALSLAEGTVAGFQAFTGISALLGDENEELLATITKLQSAQGVLNSIEILKQQLQQNSIKLTQVQTRVQKLYNSAVGNGTKAMQGFRKALLVTGIGALIVGIIALIENWDKLKESILGVNKSQQLLNETAKQSAEAIADELSASDKLQKTLNDETKTREEKVKAVKQLQEQYPNLLANVDAEKTSIEDINKALELNVKLTRLKAQQDAIAELRTEEFKNQLNAQIDAQTENNETLLSWTLGLTDSELAQKSRTAQTLADINASKEQVQVLDDLDSEIQKQIDSLKDLGAVDGEEFNKAKENSKSLADQRKKANEEYNQMLLDQANLREELRRLTLSAEELEEIAIADKYDTMFERAKGNAELEKEILANQERELNELFAKRQQAEEQRQAELNQIQIDAQNELNDQLSMIQDEYLTEDKQKEINAVTDKYFELITIAEQNGLDTAMLKERQEKELADIEDKYRNEKLAKDQEARDKQVEMFNEYANSISGGLESLDNLNQLVTTIQLQRAEGNEARQEQIQKKSFERNKKIQIGIATIQGIQGVINALTAQSVLPEPFASIQRGINAGVVATATASNIAKIKAQKYQGGASSVSAGGGTSAGAGASSFAISDNTSSEQTFLNADGSQQVGNKTTAKVIVTETDISKTQNDVQAIETKSTF